MSERERFERYAQQRFGSDLNTDRGEYIEQEVQDAWETWQARAALDAAAQPAPSTQAAMVDAFGEPRKRYVRLTVDGTHCIDKPENLADNIGDMSPDQYTTSDVYLSERELNDLPEFDGF